MNGPALLWALGLLLGGSGMAVACETWKEGGRMGAYGGGAGGGLRAFAVFGRGGLLGDFSVHNREVAHKPLAGS